MHFFRKQKKVYYATAVLMNSKLREEAFVAVRSLFSYSELEELLGQQTFCHGSSIFLGLKFISLRSRLHDQMSTFIYSP